MSDHDLLVGPDTGDDAAVYRITDDLAIIQTVDYFPPIVDDPYAFGEIAAANSLSDVYAMGGMPVIALNIVCFPVSLDKSILATVLKGGYAKAREARVLIAGGHTIDDAEPKYGLAVTGIVRPGDHISNAESRPGDVLVLSKPIGTGIITTGAKAGIAPDDVLDEAVEMMARLNEGAALSMKPAGVNACTDVTGFGLMGHLRNMMAASGVAAKISLDAVPVLKGTWDLLEQNVVPGGTRRNLDSMEGVAHWGSGISEAAKLLLCDAQTSGGLLMSVPRSREAGLIDSLRAHGADGHRIGEVVKSRDTYIEVTA